MARVDAYVHGMQNKEKRTTTAAAATRTEHSKKQYCLNKTQEATHRDEFSMRHGQHTFFAEFRPRTREPVCFHSQLSAADLSELLFRHWSLFILRKHNSMGVRLVHKCCHYDPDDDNRCSDECPHGGHQLLLVSRCLGGYCRIHRCCRGRSTGGGCSTHTARAVERKSVF